MPEADPDKIRAFSTSEELALWMRENHASETELWVKIYKKRSGVLTVVWDDVVIECLCWGWIDGIKKSLDEYAYLQRVTPRKAKSVWSKRNRTLVERLINEGRMEEPGLFQVNAAKEDRPQAKSFYGSLNKSSRCVIAYALTSAKKDETRLRRFVKYLDMLDRGEKPT